jgi:hypothetical protein
MRGKEWGTNVKIIALDIDKLVQVLKAYIKRPGHDFLPRWFNFCQAKADGSDGRGSQRKPDHPIRAIDAAMSKFTI